MRESRLPPRRIVQLSKYYPPEWGGIETVARDISVGLSRRGFVSRVVAFTKRNAETIVIDGVELVRCKERANIASQPLSFAWLRAARRAILKSDVVIMDWPNLLPAVLVPFLGRRPLLIFWHSDLIGKGILGSVLLPIQQMLLHRATRVMTTTEDYRNGSRPLAKFRHKTVALPIGIEDPLVSFVPVTVPGSISRFLDGRPYLIAIGRLVPYKGFDQLIMAVGAIDDGFALVIVGEGPMQKELEQLIARKGLSGRVLLTGKIPRDALDTLLSRAALYVMSSNQRGEGFGVVQLEAMAHSLPIVATNVPRSGVAWVSGYGSTGAMVPINDPTAIANAANQILQGPDRAALSLHSRQRFESEFTVDKMLDRFEQILTDLD
jgi:glycosyltransferase involved in cell wall biosynthesis